MLNPYRHTWDVWENLISVIACTLSNPLETDRSVWEKREKEFETCRDNIGDIEKVLEITTLLFDAALEEPYRDFLGEIYMELGLGDHWKGQYFTPGNVADMMAMITMSGEDLQEQIADHGIISVADPCCGSGVNLLAGAKVLQQRGICQTSALFVGQDIDRIVAQMCYIQLSINKLVGYVCVANTLTNPIVYDDNGTLLPQPGQEFWFTPMYRLCVMGNDDKAEEKSA